MSQQQPTSVTESLRQSVYKQRNFIEAFFFFLLHTANKIYGMCLSFTPISTQCMLTKHNRKECMFTWITVHSQNDRKQQEWKENGRKQVLVCAASTQTARHVINVWGARCRLWQLNVSSIRIYMFLIRDLDPPRITIRFKLFFMVNWCNSPPPSTTTLLHLLPCLHFKSSHKVREKEILSRRSKQNLKFGNIIILGNWNKKHWFLYIKKNMTNVDNCHWNFLGHIF